MEVTVLKLDPDNPNGKEVATFHNVAEVTTVYDGLGQLSYLIILRDVDFTFCPLYVIEDYNLSIK